MVDFTGILWALSSAIFWGTYFVPVKLMKNINPYQHQAFIGVGIFLVSLLIALIFNFNISFNLFGFVAGLMWVLGNFLATLSLSKIGLTQMSAISNTFVILTPFLWGLIFFVEPLSSLFLGIAGIVLLITGINIALLQRKSKINFLGYILSILAGIVWGSQLVPLKLSGLSPSEFFFSMALGIMVSGTIFLVKRKFNVSQIKNSLVSGVLWGAGNIGSLFAVSLLGLSVGFPLTQLALLFSVSWGLFYFKEFTGNKIIKILVGVIVIIVGAVALAFSK